MCQANILYLDHFHRIAISPPQDVFYNVRVTIIPHFPGVFMEKNDANGFEEPKKSRAGRKKIKPVAEPPAELLPPAPPKKDYSMDPAGYCKDVLGITLTPIWERIAHLMLTPPYRVLVSSGHGTGKSYGAAAIASWHFDTFCPGITLTTAPTHKHVQEILWRHIREQRYNVGLGNFVGNVVPMMRGDHPKHYAEGMACESGDSFQGRHEQHMLFLFDEACHDDQTDVLTEFGWKRFADLDGSERLLTMNPDTRVAEYIDPVRIVKKLFMGNLLEYRAKGSNWCVTPGHNMFWQRAHYHKGRTVFGRWEKSSMDDIKHRTTIYMTRTVDWQANDVETFTLPALMTPRKKFLPSVLKMDDWLEFLGWYCSEGCLIHAGKHKLVYSVAISQRPGKNADAIESVCERLGFKPKRYKAGRQDGIAIHCNGINLARWLETLGKNCLEKKVPDFIRGLSKRQIAIFLDAFVQGDGYRRSNRDIFYTSSKSMADGLQELILKTGRDSSLLKRKLKGRTADFGTHTGTSTVDGYVISRSDKSSRVKYLKRNIRVRPYFGYVYCAELPRHHLLLTRREGRVIWSGNTGVDAAFWDATRGMWKGQPGHYWLCFFNPLDVSCQAYKEWRRKDRDGKNLWHCVQMGCMDHPNVLAGLAGTPEPFPGAVSLSHFNAMVTDLCEPIDEETRETTDIEWPPDSGKIYRPSPQMDARGLGRWPSTDTFGVWSLYAWKCAMRTIEWKPGYSTLPMGGCDPAGKGDDFTAIHFRWGPLSIHHERHNGWNGLQTANRLKILCADMADRVNSVRPKDAQKIEPEQIQVNIDGDGLGVEVINQKGDFNFVAVCGSGTPRKTDQYYNKRAESWFEVCKMAKDGRLSVAGLPRDTLDKLEDQLVAPTWTTAKANGKIVLEDKEELKSRLGYSPDDADAFILAHAPSGSIASLAWEMMSREGAFDPAQPAPSRFLPPSTVDDKNRPRQFTQLQRPIEDDEDEPRTRMWKFGF